MSNRTQPPPDDDDQTYTPPADIDLERAFIGSIYLRQEALAELPYLAPADFYGAQFGDIFARMRALAATGKPLDPYTVCAGDWELQEVYQLAISHPHATGAYVLPYAKRIKELAQKRYYLHVAQTAAAYALNGKQPQDITDYLVAAVEAQQAQGVGNPFERWDEQGVTAAQAAAAAPVERQYIVEDLIRDKSVSVFFGPPGSFKSALVMDMALCIANDMPWLQRMPVEGNTQRSFATRQGRVLWLNYDQSHDDVLERLGALARSYGGGEHVTAISHSTPAAILENEGQARQLGEYCKRAQYRVIVVDSLLDVKGKADLQEAGMGDVLRMWRIVAETGGLAVILIAHSTKLTQDLYGSTFIKAKLDHLYRVTRPPGTDTVILESEKQRSYGETGKLYARFSYQHCEGTRTLQTACFWGDSTEQRTAHPNNTTQAAVLGVLMASPGRSFKTGDLMTLLNADRAEEESVSAKAIAHALDRLHKAHAIQRTETASRAFAYHYGELLQDEPLPTPHSPHICK